MLWDSPLIILALFVVVILFAYNTIGLIRKERDTARKKELILNQIDTLHKRESLLEKDIAKLNTQEGVEDTIREKYQVVKEGEKMVIIVDEQTKKPTSEDEESNHSFLGFLERLFSKK